MARWRQMPAQDTGGTHRRDRASPTVQEDGAGERAVPGAGQMRAGTASHDEHDEHGRYIYDKDIGRFLPRNI